MGHESCQRQERHQGPSDWSFGIVFAVVFAVIGLLPLVTLRMPRWWALGIAAGFLGLAMLAPRVLAPLNRLWLRLGLLLHRVVSPIALGIVFFGVITPMGVIMRLAGKDLLRLRSDASAASYWVDRKPPGPGPESLRDQF
jgi:hypothetical protein